MAKKSQQSHVDDEQEDVTWTFLEDSIATPLIIAGLIGGLSGLLAWIFKENKDEFFVTIFITIAVAISGQGAFYFQSRAAFHKLRTKLQTPGPQTVSKGEMYERMRRALQRERPNDIRVMSFQRLNPQDPSSLEQMRAYHTALTTYMADHPGTELRRILAAHTLPKLQWLRRLLDDYGTNGPVDRPKHVSIRVINCADAFGSHDPTDLPPIVQLFNDRTFLSDPYDDKVECVDAKNGVLAEFWGNYFNGLWKACKDSEIIAGSTTNNETLRRIVFERITGYISYLTRNSDSEKCVSPQQLWSRIKEACALFPAWYEYGFQHPGGHSYSRHVIEKGPQFEVMIAYWHENDQCLPHNHGGSKGLMVVLSGTAEIREHKVNKRMPEPGVRGIEGYTKSMPWGPSDEPCHINDIIVHSMNAVGDKALVTLHIYQKPIPFMDVYDIAGKRWTQVSDKCGAWWPETAEEIFPGATEGRLVEIPTKV